MQDWSIASCTAVACLPFFLKKKKTVNKSLAVSLGVAISRSSTTPPPYIYINRRAREQTCLIHKKKKKKIEAEIVKTAERTHAET